MQLAATIAGVYENASITFLLALSLITTWQHEVGGLNRFHVQIRHAEQAIEAVQTVQSFKWCVYCYRLLA